MIAQNLAHEALRSGHSVLFTTASQLLLDLGSRDSSCSLESRLRHYALVGRVSQGSRHELWPLLHTWLLALIYLPIRKSLNDVGQGLADELVQQSLVPHLHWKQ
jgi:hypothetical protein